MSKPYCSSFFGYLSLLCCSLLMSLLADEIALEVVEHLDGLVASK